MVKTDSDRMRLATRVTIGTLNMSLRGLGLVGRFGLMLYLARFLDFESVAVFGFVAAGVAIVPAFLNLGLHFRANRQFVGASGLEVGRRMRDRFLLHLIIFFPIAILVVTGGSAFDYLPHVSISFIILAAIICLCDVLLNEIHLALVSTQHPVTANIVLFFRTAIWIFPFVLLSWRFPELRTLTVVLLFWLGGQILAFAAFFVSRRKWPWSDIYRQKVEFSWLLEGFSRSFLLWLSDIGLATGQFVDRIILGFFLDIYSIGIYTFFWSMAAGVQQLVFTAVVQIATPHFVKAARSPDPDALRRLLLAEMRNVFLVALVVGGAVYLGSPLLYWLAGRDTLTEFNSLFGAMLIGVTIRLVSDVVSSGVYARGYDVRLASINMSMPFISAVVTAAALAAFGFAGMGAAFIGTNLVIFAVRIWCLREDLFRR
ncbi:lipopolysaccharide biosynthesis protein [Xanthobacter autotrophicus]|uniref:lipopolysaccharide biosynthesis protein n=1 Tax=Xanthobacter autotrophicus TaxID=280 RepID=UPI00372C7038